MSNRNYQNQRGGGGNRVYESQSGTPSYSPAQQANNTLTARGSVAWTARLQFTHRSSIFTAVGAMDAAPVQITATLNKTQADNTLVARGTVAYFGTRRVTMRMTTGIGGLPATTTFKYAFFDEATPDQLTVPTNQGSGLIDTDGNVTIQLPGTKLPVGAVGYIVMSDTSGNPDVAWKEHSGPVRIY